MKDQYHREINYLRISVTDRCNLRCFYCMPNGITKIPHEKILRDEEIITIVEEAVKIGIKKIRITGGDPLVRKGIFQLIQKIKAVPGIDEITMTTNGTLLIGNVKKLKEAGVSRVNFSLDTLDETTYKTITNSDTMLDYHNLITELQEEGMSPIKLNVVLLRTINDHEIPAFIELADKYDIAIRFIELMPVGHLDFDYDRYFISKEEILKRYPSLIFSRKELIATYFHIPGKKGEIGFISPITHQFCEYCNRLRLTSEGTIKTCLHHNSNLDVKAKTKEEIYQALQEALQTKEEKHQLEDHIISDTPMNKIGG